MLPSVVLQLELLLLYHEWHLLALTPLDKGAFSYCGRLSPPVILKEEGGGGGGGREGNKQSISRP